MFFSLKKNVRNFFISQTDKGHHDCEEALCECLFNLRVPLHSFAIDWNKHLIIIMEFHCHIKTGQFTGQIILWNLALIILHFLVFYVPKGILCFFMFLINVKSHFRLCLPLIHCSFEAVVPWSNKSPFLSPFL